MKKSDMPEDWKDLLKSMYRPASSTLDAFLLPTDDPRIHQAREKLVQESFGALDRRTGRTDWGRCESRHQRARLEEELGGKRPLTGWEEGLSQLTLLANLLLTFIFRWILQFARLCMERLGCCTGRTCVGPYGHITASSS